MSIYTIQGDILPPHGRVNSNLTWYSPVIVGGCWGTRGGGAIRIPPLDPLGGGVSEGAGRG